MTNLRQLSETGAGEHLLKKTQRAEVVAATPDERVWWTRPGLRYPTAESQQKAISRGELVKVEGPNKYFAMPSCIRTDERLQYLRPSAVHLLMEVMEELDQRINYSERGIRFAVISLYRSEEDQQDMIGSDSWYRSVPANRSSHTAGAAFDISIRSHYAMNKETGDLTPVNTWDLDKMGDFDPDALEALGAVLSEKAEQGLCNLVVGNNVQDSNYTPTCFHVCVSPQYEEMLQRQNGNN